MRNYIFGVNINGQRRRIFVQAPSFRDACEVLKDLGKLSTAPVDKSELSL